MAVAFSTRSRLPRESIPIPNPHRSTAALGQTAQCLSLCSRRCRRRIACDDAICAAPGFVGPPEIKRKTKKRKEKSHVRCQISVPLCLFCSSVKTDAAQGGARRSLVRKLSKLCHCLRWLGSCLLRLDS